MFFIRDQEGDLHDIAFRDLCYDGELGGVVAVSLSGQKSVILECQRAEGRAFITKAFNKMVQLKCADLELDGVAAAKKIAADRADELGVGHG